MNKLVSIIIPVYNVERYIEQCLGSVIEQTYRNLEVIVVDDESPDNSGCIADKIAKDDDRVKVYRIKNRGAAGARNIGLENAHGDYILFVDSDDWIESNMVEKLVSAIEETDSDVALCEYWDEYKNQSICHKFMDCSGVKTPEEFTEGMLQHWEYIVTWNKLFRNTVLEGVRFVEGHCIDDEFFTYQPVIKSKRTVLVDECLYHYRMRKSSAMLNPAHRLRQLQDRIDYITERYQPLAAAFPSLRPKLLQQKVETLISVMQNGAADDAVFRKARSCLMKCSYSVVFNTEIDINIKKSMLIYLLKVKAKKQDVVCAALNSEIYYD